MRANSSLIERIRAAARLAESHEADPRYEEREPGVRTRRVPKCRWRGDSLERRDRSCCDGKLRREERFACSNPRNGGGDAWSVMCAACGWAEEDG